MMRRQVRSLSVTLLVFACLVTVGCNVGQRSLKRDYPTCSQTIRDIEDEQMLLNLVRMRYAGPS